MAQMEAPPDGYCPVCWDRLPEPTHNQAKVGGRPRIYCTDLCKQVQVLVTTLGSALSELNERGQEPKDPRAPAHPVAMQQLRGVVWATANSLRFDIGHRPGTKYLMLVLECGHHVQRRARTRRVEGVSTLDPAPTWTRCELCGRHGGSPRRHVTVSVVATAGRVGRPWR